jgi:hypothetical protein
LERLAADAELCGRAYPASARRAGNAVQFGDQDASRLAAWTVELGAVVDTAISPLPPFERKGVARNLFDTGFLPTVAYLDRKPLRGGATATEIARRSSSLSTRGSDARQKQAAFIKARNEKQAGSTSAHYRTFVVTPVPIIRRDAV